jgi:hypothetical protein
MEPPTAKDRYHPKRIGYVYYIKLCLNVKKSQKYFIGELMEGEKFWLRIKKWQNMHRKLEEHKRKKIIKKLDKQVRDKKMELEEKKKQYANEEKKRKRVDEKLEKILREKREELERKRIGLFEKY